MTRLTVYGRLTAAEDRTLRGTLVPFGRPGSTNLGRVVVPDASHITVPDDVATLFASLDHLDGRDPVADWTGLEATPDGYVATWRARETHGGDKLLAEYAAGERRGVSMELEPVTVRDGIASGVLIGCAFPKAPAFPEARLVAELAPDITPDAETSLETVAAALADAAGGPLWGDLGDEDRAPYLEAAAAAMAAATPQTPDTAGAEDPDAEDPPADPTGDSMTTTATAPAALLAGANAAPAAPAAPARTRLLAADAGPREVFRLFAAAQTDSSARARLMAALSDIVPADTLDRDQPQWLGEVWSGNAYTRRIVPLLTTGELTDLKVKGWRWTDKPAMARYSGNKTAVPSNPVATEAYEAEAIRLAGAHDIDIKYKHFRDTAFFESYFSAMSESYARLSDAYAVEELKLNATPSVLGSVPTDVPVGWVAVLDAALDIIDIGSPTFALVEKSVYRDMFLTGKDKFLEFLNASIGFEEGTINDANFRIVPVSSTAAGDASSAIGLDAGEVLVGTRAAVKFRELGGGAPIRVEALNIANGGVDEGVFGYAHCAVEDARGVRIIDTNADNA